MPRRKHSSLVRLAAVPLLGFLLSATDACASAEQPVAGAEIAPAAGPTNGQFGQWLKALRAEAEARGIKAKTLDAALNGVQPIERVIELDRQQPESTLTFAQYLDHVAPVSRVELARARYGENLPLLQTVEKRFGVEPEFVVALWGIESDFGTHMGDFPVIHALATLAFDGRRSAYFRDELLKALVILDHGHIEPASMLGSWAGAMGQAQFMPSSFLNYAVDQNGDGRRDIWGTRADVFASTANYLATEGWKHGEGWGRQVLAPLSFDVEAAAAEKEPRPVSDWRAAGLTRADGSPLPSAEDSRMATLVLPDGVKGPAFLAYDNYRVIMHWNRSNYFVLAVSRLAEKIRSQ
ncbi:MAG: lytic murein transglycosylase [Alphaproteobacteria bacterium]|nr:lytic murein transglycosylase [Alphaproteobacteria bacterium]